MAVEDEGEKSPESLSTITRTSNRRSTTTAWAQSLAVHAASLQEQKHARASKTREFEKCRCSISILRRGSYFVQVGCRFTGELKSNPGKFELRVTTTTQVEAVVSPGSHPYIIHDLLLLGPFHLCHLAVAQAAAVLRRDY